MGLPDDARAAGHSRAAILKRLHTERVPARIQETLRRCLRFWLRRDPTPEEILQTWGQIPLIFVAMPDFIGVQFFRTW